jgi:predicted secreted protein
MLKLTSVIVSLVAVASIAQPSFAINPTSTSLLPIADTPGSDLHAQIIFKVGTPQYRREMVRRRELERQRRIERRRAARRAYNRTYRRY